MPATRSSIKIHPVTPERWGDFETLFGPRGACAGCWCMWARKPRAQYLRDKGGGNKKSMKRLIASGAEPGVIAYVDGEPAGWCSVAPRTEYTALGRSRILAPVDDKPVWSITCLFVARPYRRQGLSTELIRAAVKLAKSKRARLIEAYPHETKTDHAPDAFIWTGTLSAFRKAGFKEVERRSPGRPIVRLEFL